MEKYKMSCGEMKCNVTLPPQCLTNAETLQPSVHGVYCEKHREVVVVSRER